MSLTLVSFCWVAGNIASTVLLSCFGVIIAAGARWKGLPQSTLIIAGSSILFQIHGWIAEYARNNQENASWLLNTLAGMYFLIRPLLPTFLSFALIIIFHLLSAKAIFKAPYLAAGISSCLLFLSVFPNSILSTPIQSRLYYFIQGFILKASNIWNVLPFFAAIGFLIALILLLTMKAEKAVEPPPA